MSSICLHMLCIRYSPANVYRFDTHSGRFSKMLGFRARLAGRRCLHTFPRTGVLHSPIITAHAKEPMTIAYGADQMKDVFGNNVSFFREAAFDCSDKSLNQVKGVVRYVNRVEAARLKSFHTLRHPNLMNIHALLPIPLGALALVENFASTLESYMSDAMRRATFAAYYTDPSGLKVATVLSIMGQDFLRGILSGLCAAHEQNIRLSIFKDNIFLKHPMNQQRLYPMLGGLGSPAAYQVGKTDAEQLYDFLVKTVFKPLNLATNELLTVFQIPKSKFITENDLVDIFRYICRNDLVDIFRCPLFMSPVERADLYSDVYGQYKDMIGGIAQIDGLVNENWTVRVDPTLLKHMMTFRSYKPFSCYSFTQLQRHAIQHQADIAKAFRYANPPLPNVLGTGHQNAVLYFQLVAPNLTDLLFKLQKTLPIPVR